MKINDQTSSHEHCWHSYNGPVGAVATTPAPSPTVAHDSATCQLGPDGGKCEMCAWTERHRLDGNTKSWRDYYDALAVEQSAATIRDRRRALLERATPDALTDGALALAEAWLQDEPWFNELPNNAMQDAAVLELAGEIESAVGSWLEGQREDGQ